MSAWSKYKLGWVSPTVVSSTGTYTLGQACDHSDMIMITEGYPSGEYLLIENRQPCGFETTMTQGGLAIFHIDENANNILGHPEQVGWPQNANHYEVALLQADSSYGLEKSINRGDGVDAFHAGGVNSISPDGTSEGSQYPNTKSYQGGTVVDTEVTISNIGSAGPSMSFDITIGTTGAPTDPPTDPPTGVPTPSCSDSPFIFIVTVDGRNLRKGCDWAATGDVATKCSYPGVSETCPATCGTCSTCVDSTLRFQMPILGTSKKCGWARKNSSNCADAGVPETCRNACGEC